MKLYYSAGSCSTGCHITLEESGLKYEAVEVDWDNAADTNVALVQKLNPLGTLPVLVTEEGRQLDQNVAIHTYIADRPGSRKLLPPVGTVERAEAMNWLAFVTSDLHKSIGGMFSIAAISPDKAVRDTVRAFMVGRAAEYLAYMNAQLAGKDYLTGKDFTPADAYAFIVLSWTRGLKLDMAPYPNIQAYQARIAARPAVAKVMKEEGLD